MNEDFNFDVGARIRKEFPQREPHEDRTVEYFEYEVTRRMEDYESGELFYQLKNVEEGGKVMKSVSMVENQYVKIEGD